MRSNYFLVFLSVFVLNFFLKINTKADGVILKDSISSVKVLRKKEEIPVAFLSLVSSEYSKPGDLVEAQIIASEDSNNQALKSLKGAILKGRITELKKSRHLNRSGYIKIVFDSLQIDVDFSVPIIATLSTEEYFGQNAKKSVSDNFLDILLPTTTGAINSLVFAPFSAFSTSGLSVLVGAGIGSTIGTINSLKAKGDHISIFPGERAKVTFFSGLEVSLAELESFRRENKEIKRQIDNLDFKIIEKQIAKSEIFGGTLVTKIDISNQSNATLYPCDFFLLPKDGSPPVPVDLRLSGIPVLKSIKHGQRKAIKLYFAIEKNRNLSNYKLVIIDPIDKTKLSEMSFN